MLAGCIGVPEDAFTCPACDAGTFGVVVATAVCVALAAAMAAAR